MSDAIRFTYKPEGADVRTWTVDPLRGIRASEYIALQKASGIRGVQDLMEGLAATDMLAIKGLLWLLLKRTMATLSWDSLDFTLDEIEIDSDEEPGEMLRKLEALEAQDTLNEVGETALRRLREQGVVAAPAGEEDPKA